MTEYDPTIKRFELIKLKIIELFRKASEILVFITTH